MRFKRDVQYGLISKCLPRENTLGALLKTEANLEELHINGEQRQRLQAVDIRTDQGMMDTW